MALSDMPADVEQAFNTLLQAELNHRRQQQKAKSQQAQQEQLMQIESQKLSNQMFQTALKGQLDTKSQQLKSAQQQSDSTLEMYRFLSEQEDKRQIAGERERSKRDIAALRAESDERRAEKEHLARMDRLKETGSQKTGHIKQETAAKSMLQGEKYGLMEGLAELNNSAHLKRMSKKHGYDLKFSDSQNEFKAGQKELDRASSKLLQKNRLASVEERSKLDRNLRKLLHSDKLNFQMFENQLNRENKLAVAGLRADNTDATKESQVKNLRNLAKTYKIMTAASSGADMLNLEGGKHNNESRAYMKIMAALDTAASDVESRGGDWREILNTYLETNEIQLALANSDEAAAQFKTLELFYKGGGEMPRIETQGQQRERTPTEYAPEPEPEPIPGPGGGSGGGAKGRGEAMKELDRGY